MAANSLVTKILREFVYGGHLQSLGAASIVFITSVLLDFKITWDVLVTTYLIFYPLYLYNRFREIDTDHSTNPGRTEHFKTYIGRMPIILYTTTSLAVLSLIYFSNTTALVFGVILLVGGLLYTEIFKRLTKIIPAFKNIYVALFFASLVPWLVVYYEYDFSLGVWLLTGFVYFKALGMQIFLDIKDKKTDEAEGLRTLVNCFTKKDVIRGLKIFTVIITVGLPILFSFIWPVLPRGCFAFVLTIPLVFYALYLVGRKKYSAYILIGSEFLAWTPLVLATKYFL